MVKRLVKTGITICATIHSPTPYGRTYTFVFAIYELYVQLLPT